MVGNGIGMEKNLGRLDVEQAGDGHRLMLEGIAAQLVETDAEYLRVIYFALAQKKTFGEESSTQESWNVPS